MPCRTHYTFANIQQVSTSSFSKGWSSSENSLNRTSSDASKGGIAPRTGRLHSEYWRKTSRKSGWLRICLRWCLGAREGFWRPASTRQNRSCQSTIYLYAAEDAALRLECSRYTESLLSTWGKIPQLSSTLAARSRNLSHTAKEKCPTHKLERWKRGYVPMLGHVVVSLFSSSMKFPLQMTASNVLSI